MRPATQRFHGMAKTCSNLRIVQPPTAILRIAIKPPNLKTVNIINNALILRIFCIQLYKISIIRDEDDQNLFISFPWAIKSKYKFVKELQF